jgi:hypothetical protein
LSQCEDTISDTQQELAGPGSPGGADLKSTTTWQDAGRGGTGGEGTVVRLQGRLDTMATAHLG